VDAPRSGRPRSAPNITDKRIVAELKRNPLKLGYNTTVWTVEIVARHLSQRYGCEIRPFTLYRRMKAMGLRCKRPRYVYWEKDPHRAQKKGAIVRKLSTMPLSAVLLFQDEIQVRLFPVLRRAWALRGEPATVGISGENAKEVLFGTINLRTGHRIVMRYPRLNQAGFQAFLYLLRHRYPARVICLLLDAGSSHTAPRSKALAQRLNITLIWLPKQCPELNAMDHLFKEVKADVSANFQYQNIDEHAQTAAKYILQLTNKQALTKAGILSKNFWLKSFFK
jgi:transposase